MHDRIFWRSWADTQHAQRRARRRTQVLRWVGAIAGVLVAVWWLL